jgi:hypothetical protein
MTMASRQFWKNLALFTCVLTSGVGHLRLAQAHALQSVEVRCLANYSGCAISVDGVPHSKFYFLNPLSVYNYDETGPGWSETSGAYIDYPEHMDVPVFHVHSEYPEWRPDAQFSVVERGEPPMPYEDAEQRVYFQFVHIDEEMNFLPFASCSSTYKSHGGTQQDAHIMSVLGESATQEPVFVSVEADPYEQPVVFQTTGNDGPMRRTLSAITDIHVAPYNPDALELQFTYPEGYGFSVEVLSALAVISAAR